MRGFPISESSLRQRFGRTLQWKRTRAFQRDITSVQAADIMSSSPITVEPDARMSDVVDLLTANKIATLFIVEDRRPMAIVHIAELMQAGYVA